MSLRRPPTAVALQPSDVADLQAAIAQRNAEPADPVATAGAAAGAADALLEKEQREERERQARGARARVVGGATA